jgi:hypothetical protein
MMTAAERPPLRENLGVCLRLDITTTTYRCNIEHLLFSILHASPLSLLSAKLSSPLVIAVWPILPSSPLLSVLPALPPPTMLDAFEIITTSGVVLWSRSYADIGASLVNDFIHAVFIQDQLATSSNAPYRSQGKTIKWTTAKDLGLVFVVRLPALPASCSLARPSTSRSFASRGSTSF